MGAKNRKLKGDPGYRRVGRPTNAELAERTRAPKYTIAQMLEYKAEILRLLESGECLTLAEAAKRVGAKPTRVYAWLESDPDFKELHRLVKKMAADAIEVEFRTHANFIPQMMLLKGAYPEYRDNYRFIATSGKLEELLKELAEVARKQNKGINEPSTKIDVPVPEDTKQKESV